MAEENLLKENGEKVKVSRRKSPAITILIRALNRHDEEIKCDVLDLSPLRSGESIKTSTFRGRSWHCLVDRNPAPFFHACRGPLFVRERKRSNESAVRLSAGDGLLMEGVLPY